MNQVLLYYKYVSVADPETERDAQRELCNSLGLLGRILIGQEGINGTVAGPVEATDAYRAAMDEHPLFNNIDYKIDSSDVIPFRKLKVKARSEIVTLGVPTDLARTAPHLSPDEFHELVDDPDVVLFDARNNYEAAIGKFRGAITPDINLFNQLPGVLDNYAELKDKKVVAYCTGGIRCEKATALMIERGFSKVYQLDGGIIKYAQKFPNGAFEGECFVFDERMSVGFTDNPAQLGTCHFCTKPTNQYRNCANPTCNDLILVCQSCNDQAACGSCCQKLLGQLQAA